MSNCNPKEKTELQKLNEVIDSRVESKVEALKGDLTKTFAVHTSKKSHNRYDKIEKGTGEAFKVALPVMYDMMRQGKSLTQLSKEMDKDFVTKFLGEDNANSGGDNVIPIPLAQDVIPALYKPTLVSQWGARMIPMSTTKMEITRQSSKPTASYTDEGATIAASNANFGKVQMDLKKLAARSEVANEFLRRNSTVSMEFLFQDLVQAASVAMDEAFLRGAGGLAPTGIFGQIQAGNKFQVTAASPATVTLSDLEDAFDLAELAILQANHARQGMSYALCSRDFLKLRRQRESGLSVFPGLSEASMTLRGLPVHLAETIIQNADDSGDGDSDESRIYVGHGSNILVGIGTDLRLEMSPHEKFSSDMTVIRLIMENDCVLRYVDGIAVISTDYSG